MRNLKTFKEWNKQGIWIAKGQKAMEFNENGEAMFDESQTKKPTFSREDMRATNHFLACETYGL